jgi:PleD family two-component response regulator
MSRREAEAELLQALRNRTPLAIVVMAVDRFSAVKEPAGREAAGRALHQVAAIVTKTLRKAGQAGRVGEEFAISLPGQARTGPAARRSRSGTGPPGNR